MSRFSYFCIQCERSFASIGLAASHQHQPLYNHWQINYPYHQIGRFPLAGRGMVRYLPLLPVTALSVTLGEGETPLLPLPRFGRRHQLTKLWVKNEGMNPTLSFKDRESAMVINAQLGKQPQRYAIVSSGNAALSLAAYGRRAGATIHCYVPHHSSEDKKRLIAMYGAKLSLISGDYETCYRYLVDHLPAGEVNATSGQHLLRDEGGKTVAYEIWEAIGVPGVIICPMGNGALLSALYAGFFDLLQLKKIQQLPRLIGVQIKNAAPIVAAWPDQSPYVSLESVPDSLAEGIVARESYAAPKALRALRLSGGRPVTVTDQMIKKALREIIELESLIPEPTAAVVYAAVRTLTPSERRGSVVVIQTGGAKSYQEILSW